MRRFCIIIKRLEEVGQSKPRYQAQLRPSILENHVCFSRREDRASKVRRAIESLFGPLKWELPSAKMLDREPSLLQVAYVESGDSVADAGRKGGLARRDNLTPEERSDACRRAAVARWEREKKDPSPPDGS